MRTGNGSSLIIHYEERDFRMSKAKAKDIRTVLLEKEEQPYKQ
jgi:hypothetical protein